MRQFFKLICVCLAISVITACESINSSNTQAVKRNNSIQAQISEPSSAPPKSIVAGQEPLEAQIQDAAFTQSGASDSAAVAIERKIIRNATLTLEADSPEDAGRKIASIAAAKNGFVITSDTQQHNFNNLQSASVNITLRVPANQFDAALNEIRQTASRVVQEKISGQDVTEEFVDLEARIKAKKALEAQFLEIMKQAHTVEDALKVQTQISEVRTEIEKLQGRHRFLENQSELSTINLTLDTPAQFAANSRGFSSELLSALSDGINGALAIFLFFIRAILALLPIIILFGLPVYLLIRYLREKNKRQKLAAELTQEDKI